MDHTEFIDWAKKKFTRDEKDEKTIIEINDLMRWVRAGEVNVGKLHEIILENWDKGYFPPRKLIKQWYEAARTDRHFNRFNKQEIVDAARAWPVMIIVELLEEIANWKPCRVCGKERCNSGILFFRVWGDLLHVDGHLKDKGWNLMQREEYLTRVKLSIIDGQVIYFNPDKMQNYLHPDEQEKLKQENLRMIVQLQKQGYEF